MANNGTAPDLQAIRDEITRVYNSTEDYTQQANMQPYNSGMTRDQIASIYYDGAVPSANDIPVLQPMNQQPIQAQTPTQKQNTPTTTQKPQKDVEMERAKEIGRQARLYAESGKLKPTERALSANEQRDMERAMNARKEAEDRRKKTVTETVKTEERLSGKMPSEITSGTVNKDSEYDERGFRKNKAIFNEFLDPNKKLSQQEQKQAWDMINNYEQSENGAKNENATTLVFDEEHPDGISVPVYTVDENGNYDPSKELSQSDKDYRKNIYDLKAKVSNADATYNGLASGLVPFYEAGMRLTDYDGEWQKAQGNSAKQNPLAYNASRLMGGLAASLTGQAALRGTKYADALGKLIGEGGVAKEILKDALSDMPIDLAVDILPSIAADIAAGKDANEVIKSALANIGLNAGLNTGAAVIGNAGDILTSLRPKSVLDDTLKNLEGADLFAEMANRGRNVEAPAEGIDYFAQMASDKRAADAARSALENADDMANAIDDRFLKDTDLQDYLHSGKGFHKNRADAVNRGENVIIRSLSELKNKINNIIHSEDADVTKMQTVGFMRVGSNISDQIKNLDNSIDTSNYFFQIEPNDLRHTYIEHFKPKIDGDLPMDEEDVAYALSNINSGMVESVEKIKGGGKRAKIRIEAPDGNYYTIQVVSKNDGALSLKSLWKTEKDALDATEDILNPTTVRSQSVFSNGESPTTDSLSDLKINQMDESVNPQSVTQGSVNEVTKLEEPQPQNAPEITKPVVTPEVNEAGESAPEITNKPVNTETGNMPEKGSGERQISKYRTNSMKKLDSVNEQNMPTEDFGYNRFSVEEQTQQGIERWGNNPNAVRDLQNKESWDEVDSRYAQDRWTELMESENEDDLKEALKLARKQSYELREGGRLVQTAAGMDDIASRMNMARQEMNAAVDKAHGVGTSEALDNVATQLDVSLSDADLGTKEGREKVADIVSKKLKNRTLRDYAPSNKAMKSAENVKKFKNTDKIISKIKAGKYKNVDDLIADVYRQNGGVPISSADQKKIYNLLNLASTMENGSYTQEIVLARAAKTAMKGAPSTLSEKVRSVLYANMLGNFKTAVSRNAFGNFGFQVLEQARSPIAALVDSATSLATKQRTTQGWNIGKAKAYGRGFVKGAKEQAGDIVRGTNTGRSGSTGWANALKENKHTWNEAGKTKVGNAIAKMANDAEFYVSSAMKMGDRPFFEANFAQRQTELHQLVDKYGKERVAGLSDIPDELLDDTIDMMSAVHAADSVFQKKGKIAEGLSDIRNGLGKSSEGGLGIDILSTSSAPFTLTPGNILQKTIEYSPLGLVKNAINTGKEIANKSFNQKRFVDELSRTITGLPVLGAAYGLAKNGMISGGYSEDKDEKAQQIADDYIEYGFTNPLTGKTYDTSDIPVLGSFMQAAGAVAEDGFTPEALMQGAEAVTLGSTMQGLRKAFGSDVGYSSSGSMLESLGDTAFSSLTQFVPSLVRQTAQTSDKYKRDLGEYGTAEYYLNNVKNSIPGARQTLPIKYDSEGNPILQNQGRPLENKIAENYLLPMKVSEYKQSELTQEALRLKNATDGDNRAFVPKAQRSDPKDWAKKAEKEYSEEMFYNYKKDFGELNKKAGEFVIHSDFYNSLDPETQVNVLSDVYSAMKQVAKNNAVGLDTDNKLANTYMNAENPEQGLNDILENLTYKYNPYGIDADAYKQMLDSNEDMTKYEGYKDALSQYDVEDNKAYRDAYVEGGAEKLGEEIGYQSALKDAGLSDSKSNRNAYGLGGADRLNSVADTKAKAIELGFTDADGSANTGAYQNAITVLGDDASAKSYAGFANTMKEKGYTKQEQYIPYLESTSMTDEQKGQYAYLYGGVKAGSSAEKVLKDKGYEYFYLYRLLQNPEDLNNNGKKDPGDRAKTLYNWGLDNKSDAYRYFIEGDLSY